MKYFFKLFLMLLLASNAYSADFLIKPIFNKGILTSSYALMTGEIKKGDAKKLITLIESNKKWIDSISLDSLGGEVTEAIKLGEIIKGARLTTIIQPEATCASACFFVWLNGTPRMIISDPGINSKTGAPNTPGRVGLHRPYLASFSNNAKSINTQSLVMKIVDNYLIDKRIPRRLIDIMMARPSNDIYWIKDTDIEDIGEIPPETEELYIAKCNDNRKKIYRDLSLAKSSGNDPLIQHLNSSLQKIYECVNNLDDTARQQAISAGLWQLVISKN